MATGHIAHNRWRRAGGQAVFTAGALLAVNLAVCWLCFQFADAVRDDHRGMVRLSADLGLPLLTGAAWQWWGKIGITLSVLSTVLIFRFHGKRLEGGANRARLFLAYALLLAPLFVLGFYIKSQEGIALKAGGVLMALLVASHVRELRSMAPRAPS